MKKIFIIIVSIIFLELFIRATIPIYGKRYINKIPESNKTNMFGINIYNKYFGLNNNFEIRDSKVDISYNDKDIIIDLIGDSVSKGYGLRYQDTFFSVSENILNQMKYNLSIIPFAFSGTNLINTFDYYKEYYKNKPSINNKILIYQFNFNDIVPSNDPRMRWQNKDLSVIQKIIIETGKFRYKYLNRSAILSLIQFNLGKIKYKKNKTCEEREIFALGPYSYSYGAKGFEDVSEREWEKFENKIIEVNNFAKDNNLTFIVLIIPTILDFDYKGSSNPYNFNLSCSTIDANDRITKILKRNNVTFIQPKNYMKKLLNNYLKEDNPISPFFDLDSNHPNEVGSRMIGEYLAINIIDYLDK